ncbi:MAG: 2-oxoglutarate dehydrogenase E1 component [Acidobacteria bacterium]|nr:2-oxoglutarate dehydrogenase E1 component [Acidobacteriota bacterium]
MNSSHLDVYSQNVTYIEALFHQYLADPNSVDPSLRNMFASWDSDTSRPVLLEETGGIAGYLRRLPLFSEMSHDDLMGLTEITERVGVSAGETLARAGQVGNDLYIILDGIVAIMRQGELISQLGAGEVVGELAVLDSRPRSADIVAQTALTLLRIRKADFEHLMDQRHGFTKAMLTTLAQRLRVAGSRQERVDNLIRAYRERGHVIARLDPLNIETPQHPELTLAHYGFSEADLDQRFTASIGSEITGRTLRHILEHLQKTYCRAIGVQYMHIDDMEIQEWLRRRMEDTMNERPMSRAEQVHILSKLTDAEVFESFLHRKFVGSKRFSLEGGESLIPLLDWAIEEAGRHGIDEVVLAMAHRGRLNVLANIMGKPAHQIFREFQDVDGKSQTGRGDVKYHLGYSSDRATASGHNIHLSLCFNPSHLEFVTPVAFGRVRAKQDRFGDKRHERALALVIHGDAAFAGQGVTQESLNLSRLDGYATGGAIHVILNNQIGFTTLPHDSRSTQYCTDVARMLQVPIFHVNGENPEAVAQVIQLAMDFRQKFKMDVVIDMYCYRKYGHNEGDDPTFTQPKIYEIIKNLPTVREAYIANVLKMGEITQAEADQIAEESKARLEADLATSKEESYTYTHFREGMDIWGKYRGGPDADTPDVATCVDITALSDYLTRITHVPDTFSAHPKIMRFLDQQREMSEGKQPLNWGTAELLAYASLVAEGTRVRLSGQDSGRGTFSHRHAILFDTKNGQTYVPLQHVRADQAPFRVFNSPLTEIAVLGFEYGYSMDYPDGLVIWEAQFGDFCNVAQVVIDQFITSSEDKWNRLNSLVMLLPHGFEGQGPEHSSARLERFLNLAAEDNIQVVNLTTPAQLFHCLRRQVVRPIRKPLMVMSPKSLLRHPKVTSTLEELATGEFQRVIPDTEVDPRGVKRIMLCSGKVYYDLLEARAQRQAEHVAIVRLEQYYPIPYDHLEAALRPFDTQAPVTWIQEEPSNMGAWPFIHFHFERQIANRNLNFVARAESSSPATGSSSSHKHEQADLMDRAFQEP